ncbi:hypothetical protein GCM10009764_31650 [Nocardia ninae]|uniref:Uncharacterized protein n=1 Tax=Nocardia ninae NBRC 108245 TaxID=1210091 RepID=A0A511MFU1_9NOCA|nr:hypothetical protein NN4_40530 [Nocardia ninae NBRC 108245]
MTAALFPRPAANGLTESIWSTTVIPFTSLNLEPHSETEPDWRPGIWRSYIPFAGGSPTKVALPQNDSWLAELTSGAL